MPFELPADLALELFDRLGAYFLREFLGELGDLLLLDVLERDAVEDFLSRELLVGMIGREVDFDRARFADLHAGKRVLELVEQLTIADLDRGVLGLALRSAGDEGLVI